MSSINVSHLTFCYDSSYDDIFEDVSFQIDTDWKLGFCGRNGRGKTTFLNLLLGRYDYQGTITASVGFEYFPFAVPDKSVETLQLAGDVPLWQLRRELSLLRVDEEVLYRPFETLSNGEQTKVLLASLFLRDNRFLLIDEPTNHLDIEAREVVAEYLRGKSGFILVSHDRAFLDGCVDHILSINRADIQVTAGNFSCWYQNKALQDQFELRENEKLKKDIARLDAAAKEKAKWSQQAEDKKIGQNRGKVDVKMGYAPKQGAKAKKMMSRAKAIEGRQNAAIREKEGLLKNLESTEELKLSPLSFHSKRLMECRDTCLYYGEKTVCEGITLTLEQGDRVALRGKNGCGKSSLLKLLCGEDMAHSGEFFRASGLKISYVPQDTGFLHGTLPDYESENGLPVSLFRAILRKLDFSRVQFEKNLEDLSAGQKKKILLARSLSESAHVYIWDEPLNYIDVLSRMQIEELLNQYKPTLLFVEHDRAFCEGIATKVVEL